MIVQFVFNFMILPATFFVAFFVCTHTEVTKAPQNETITHYNDFTHDTAITDVPIDTCAKSEVDQMSHCWYRWEET